jgi:hypothetical protein
LPYGQWRQVGAQAARDGRHLVVIAPKQLKDRSRSILRQVIR